MLLGMATSAAPGYVHIAVREEEFYKRKHEAPISPSSAIFDLDIELLTGGISPRQGESSGIGGVPRVPLFGSGVHCYMFPFRDTYAMGCCVSCSCRNGDSAWEMASLHVLGK